MTDELRRSPLDARHRALNARMVPFGGWEMPIQYVGVLEEHRACRSDAVVFDVSHLGSVVVRGPHAVDALQWALTNDLGRIGPGRAQYSHLLDAGDAHVVDDVIVWWIAADDLVVMPNASNTAPLVDVVSGAVETRGGGEVRDVTATRAVLAVQGPRARERLANAIPAVAEVGHNRVARITWDAGTAESELGTDMIVAGTGYTGEDGVEIDVPAAAAGAVWDTIVATGVRPAGLGARDTLRLEMGYPLHGHELGPGITSLQAGLGWVVRLDKGDFRGKGPLAAERARGVERLLFGLLSEGRQIPRADCAVTRDGEHEPSGVVTSGNFSPTLERGIALAFLPPDTEPGATVTIDVRGRPVAATVVRPPFVHPTAG